jgi:hypothetical protein
MEETKKAYRILVEKPRGKFPAEDWEENAKLTLKFYARKAG